MSRRTQGAHAQSTHVPVADDAALSLRSFGVTFAGSDTPASTGIDLDLRPDASRPSWESPAPGSR